MKRRKQGSITDITGKKSSFGLRMAVFMLAFAAIGVTTLILSHAASSTSSVEPESGTPTGNITKVNNDATASNAGYVKFNAATTGTFDPHQTLPPGSTLPSDATCNSRVIPATETRAASNGTQNATAGHQKNLGGTNARVDGLYTGTTDEILQWTACKWGIDVDIVRAQAAKESWWTMGNKGDYGTDASSCPPNHGLGVDGTPGQCPQSYGILQVRYPYHGPPAGLATWPDAEVSTAYNADYAYAQWRSCYEGNLGWLNDVEHVGTYTAGDAWGCVGTWFAGRWHTADANGYIQAVQDYMNQKIWTNPDFINFRP
jgi:hypothetical protein